MLYRRRLIKFYIMVFFYYSPKILCDHQDHNVRGKADNEKNIFTATFIQTRFLQKEAIQSVLQLQNYEKQYKIADKALEKIFEIVADRKVIVENSNYIPGLEFPSNTTIAAALQQIVENTAMFGDFQLKLPDITDRIMKNHPNWLVLMKWAVGFSNSTGIYDGKTTQMIDLLCQEMNLIERKENFINPYRKYDVEVPKESTSSSSKPKPKKLNFKKGPRMTKPRHSEF